MNLINKETFNMKPEDICAGKLFDLLEYEDINSKSISFEGQLRPIYNFVREKKFENTLEVGLAIGGSACHILAATNGRHVAMDPFQRVTYKNSGLKNVNKFEFRNKFEFHNEYSDIVFPKLLKADRKFDFIFIDGDHKFDFALIDFFYSDFLLKEGGYLLIDDAWMPSVKRVTEFIKVNRKDYLLSEPIYKMGALYKKNGGILKNSFKNF